MFMLIYLSSFVWAAAAGGLVWILLDIIYAPRVMQHPKGRFEDERREKLRWGSTTYRLFEPWIDELKVNWESARVAKAERVRRQLVTAGYRLKFEAAEYLAMVRIEAFGCAAGAALAGWLFYGFIGAAISLVIGFVMWEGVRLGQLSRDARKRQRRIQKQLASAVDLLALMMEVGGSFPESLEKVAEEAQQNELGKELYVVLSQLESGATRRSALRDLGNRIDDDETRELVSALIQGDELGTPIANVLRIQANQMRLKRSQWAEKESQEAQVTIVFPAMLITVACMLIVVAPFVLSAVFAENTF